MSQRPRVVISACLLGERVRYDGRSKVESSVVQALEGHVDLVAICPEVECGLPVPRPPMRLEGDPAAPRLVVIDDRVDHTERFRAWLAPRMEELAALDPAGFVLKARSPSCGVGSSPVFDAVGELVTRGGGLFARAVRERLPGVLIVEEGDLPDPAAMKRFLARIR